ncbi:hypothetical protein [Methanolobus profundi]|uniref:Uncharacterized protein n=1 Tax=Methanolobus profundi TaxID=487685 RepID=A0A1I4PJF9_9EURY|nr:hypothetical protein [Methanolobus profundi]SFM27939.1 hypothetical protein SAMN04488696_0705 [Methanolobus profundi]
MRRRSQLLWGVLLIKKKGVRGFGGEGKIDYLGESSENEEEEGNVNERISTDRSILISI